MKMYRLTFGIFLTLAWSAVAALPVQSQPETNWQPRTDIFQNIKFRDIGPAAVGGRVTGVVGIPGKPQIYYVGTAGGGVWKSTDGGFNWKAVFTDEPTSSIGTIALAPSNPNLVWVGTGEVNIRNDVLDGAGLYFSPDAGKSWRLMGFKDAGNIAKVIVDPHNSNVVWVAVFGHVWGPNAERGVFKTIDGGRTWKKVLFVNDHTGAIDLTMDGNNPHVLFAAMWQAQRYPWKLVDGGADSGIWRSVDGGNTWTKLTDGVPQPPIGRISVATAPSNPQRVYALIQARHGLLFTSDDMGDHWKVASDDSNLDARPFYFSHVYVAPHDENKLYFASYELMESDDGGHTAHPIDSGVHVDHHAFWQDPDNPERMIQGNDGGVYLSLDGGANWRHLDTLPIEQFYQVAADSRQPYDLCGGLQDNDSWCGPSTTSANGFVHGIVGWFGVTGGDGQYIVPAPSDPDIIYGDAQNGTIVRDVNIHERINIQPYRAPNSIEIKAQKYRFNWTSPIAVSPTDANTVFLGGNVVFKSKDGGTHWDVISPDLTRNDKSKQLPSGGPVSFDRSGAEVYDTILSISLAPTDTSVIWVGTDDGLVHVTRDGGAHWSNVTPPGAPKWARVYQVGVSPFNAGKAYVAFDNHEMDDHKAYVYETDNYGQSWHSLAKGLPDEPVIVVREDPNQMGFLVLGNMTGLWFSRDDGVRWNKFQSGFPTAPVFDIKFVHHDLVVATHGRGLFVLDNLRPFEEMNEQIASQNFHLFTPSVGTEYLREAGHVPQPALIDYYLKNALKSGHTERTQNCSPVTIVITDSSGQPVATEYGLAKAGVNEYRWRMHYSGPMQIDSGHLTKCAAPFSAPGPVVLPGIYHVVVTADGQSQNTTVTVRSDPNLNVPMEIQRANLKFGLEARNHVSAFNDMVNRITAMQETLSAFEHAASVDGNQHIQFAGLVAQVQVLDKTLTTFKNSMYGSPAGQSSSSNGLRFIPSLARELSSVDANVGFVEIGRSATQPPTPEDLAYANTVWSSLNNKIAEFNALLTGDVTSYNKAAFAAGAPTLGTAQISVEPVHM